MEENRIYDIVIIGCGVAGMTSAIYAGRANKLVAVVDKNGFGGNIANSPKVENIPGFASISGVDFATKMYEQMSTYPTVEHIMSEVIYVDYKHGLLLVTLDDRTVVCGKTIIIATGTKHKELQFISKDICYCVTCDGPLYKNKNVMVVGSGNTGATYALELAEYCKTVYICDITRDMCCEKTLADRVAENRKIHWLPLSTINEVKNDKDGHLTAVKMDTMDTIKVSAIFAAIGMEPKTELFKQFVEIENGYIKADESCITNKVPGIFVAGDCRTKKVRQVATAVSDGATAAIEALNYLRKNNL